MSEKMKWLKLTVVCGLGFAAVFSLVSLVFYFGEWKRLLLVASFGVFVGVLAAPEFDRKAFKAPSLFQTISGLIAGGIVGYGFLGGVEALMLASLFGGMAGFSAPFWVKHVPIP